MSLVGINFTVHKEGFKFIGVGLLVSLVFMLFSPVWAWICLVLTVFCAFFFRNPPRVIPADLNLLVSPADGTVCGIDFEIPTAELGLGDKKRYKVSIFLSIFNVHINRLPMSGKVKSIIYHPGSFLNAALDKASVFNERNTIVLAIGEDQENLMAFTQVAGMIARRIVCDIHEGQEVNKGDIFGLIRFGSRCDIWLPVGAVPQVIKGQTMVAGETILSDLSVKMGVLREGVTI
ncbi:MAG: phosphatidylserine decarboxylase [Holosporales bacterium]|jgi:phosphatidylserine decarboxylase|nr:phosphatidylserine decarboxylase [Holosporales bacterium]